MLKLIKLLIFLLISKPLKQIKRCIALVFELVKISIILTFIVNVNQRPIGVQPPVQGGINLYKYNIRF